MTSTFTDDMLSIRSTNNDERNLSGMVLDLGSRTLPKSAAKDESIHASVANHMPQRSPTRDEMDAVFQMCRSNQWNSVLNSVRSNPRIAVTSMTMQNHITTTIIHQAITSKGETSLRARVVEEILDVTPEAASIKNGYGSLPLHVIAQRNTKMDATTKELLIRKLVRAFPGALTQQGGVGMRTPLHIIFTGMSFAS
jgi:hypothetical protein